MASRVRLDPELGHPRLRDDSRFGIFIAVDASKYPDWAFRAGRHAEVGVPDPHADRRVLLRHRRDRASASSGSRRRRHRSIAAARGGGHRRAAVRRPAAARADVGRSPPAAAERRRRRPPPPIRRPAGRNGQLSSDESATSASRSRPRCSTTSAIASRRTRWPDQIPGSGWGYGTDLAYLQDLCEYWRTTFDWRAQEAPLQSVAALPHRDRRAADPLHPRALRRARRVAAVITHGWPGSVSEFLDVIEPLRDPRARRRSADAFHVVVPVAARLRLVGPDDATRAGTCGASPSVEGVDGAPRLRPVRRAGWRLGRDGLAPARRRRSRARRRPAQQHAARRSPTDASGIALTDEEQRRPRARRASS